MVFAYGVFAVNGRSIPLTVACARNRSRISRATSGPLETRTESSDSSHSWISTSSICRGANVSWSIGAVVFPSSCPESSKGSSESPKASSERPTSRSVRRTPLQVIHRKRFVLFPNLQEYTAGQSYARLLLGFSFLGTTFFRTVIADYRSLTTTGHHRGPTHARSQTPRRSNTSPRPLCRPVFRAVRAEPSAHNPAPIPEDPPAS